MTRITNIFNYAMSNTDVLQLMNGVVDIHHFAKFYLTGNKKSKYDIRVDHHFHGTWHRYVFRESYNIYINNMLVYQKCDKFQDMTILKNNIKKVEVLMRNKSYVEKALNNECGDIPYLHREWSVIGEVPVIINCKYEDDILYTCVYKQQNDDTNNEFGDCIYESEEKYEYLETAIEYAENIEQVLYTQYYYNEKREMLVHCDDDDEEEEDNEE